MVASVGTLCVMFDHYKHLSFIRCNCVVLFPDPSGARSSKGGEGLGARLVIVLVSLIVSSTVLFTTHAGEQFVILDTPLLFESGNLVSWMKRIVVVYW